MLSWPRFVDYVNLRFGPPIRSNSLGELKDLHRVGTVEEYQRKFLALLCRCERLLFTAGLGQPLSSDVEMQRPRTVSLQTAMSLARAYERRQQEADHAASQPAGRLSTRAKGAQLAGQPNSKLDVAPWPKFRRLSPEEMADKRRKGECYFCTEKFGPDHKCTSKGIFLLELEDDASEDDAAADLGISLHALTGITTANTMQLCVRVGDADLLALVDSSSTHTFINTATAQRLGLPVHRRPGLSVKVANGDRVSSFGLCPEVALHIQSEAFYINCYALVLDGFDIVLGAQWLASLGPIVWDFAALSMEF
ncbi:hypothetical protein BS78_10G151600 [Paspalum vaginatum]|nr:hypothetical protein BS78_10G151600 [Paspalum vaginatum]